MIPYAARYAYRKQGGKCQSIYEYIDSVILEFQEPEEV